MGAFDIAFGFFVTYAINVGVLLVLHAAFGQHFDGHSLLSALIGTVTGIVIVSLYRRWKARR